MRRGLAIAAILAVVVAGCGSASRNDEASRSAGRVVADAERAALGSQEMHVVGRTLDGTKPLRLDLWLRRDRAKGHFVEGGTAYDAVRIGDTMYVRGPMTGGTWKRGSATTGRFASLATLLDRTAFVHTALGQHGTIVNKGVRTRQGEQVIEIRDTTQGGSLFVAATGTPYPIALVGDASQGAVEFRDWDQPVSIRAPRATG